jgi:tetratricopeptide (TPR) repeat protein
LQTLINPKYANAYSNRGEAKIELGQKQAGLDDLNRAVELFRQQGRIDLSEQVLGTIKKTQGDKK